jgi:hypothetical protein
MVNHTSRGRIGGPKRRSATGTKAQRLKKYHLVRIADLNEIAMNTGKSKKKPKKG